MGGALDHIRVNTHKLMILVAEWWVYKEVHYTTPSIFEYFGNFFIMESKTNKQTKRPRLNQVLSL